MHNYSHRSPTFILLLMLAVAGCPMPLCRSLPPVDVTENNTAPQSTIGLDPLSKVGTFGDTVHWAEPIGADALCCVTQSRLYLCTREDVSEVIDSILLPYRLPRMFVHYKGHIYIAQQEDQALAIFDVSDGKIRRVGTLPVQLDAHVNIARDGDRLFVPDVGTKQLRVYSLAAPANPRELSHCPLPENRHPTSVRIVNDRAYVLGHDYLAVCDIRKRGPGSLLGYFDIEKDVSVGALVVKPPYAYVIAGHELRVFDVSDPDNIAQLSKADGRWHSHAAIRKNGFMAFSDNGHDFYSLANPRAPIRIRGPKIAGGRFRLAGESQDFFVDADGRAEPTEQFPVMLPFVGDAKEVWRFRVGDGFACAIASDFKVFDLSDPTQPRLCGELARVPYSARTQTALVGTRLYLPAKIIDCADPANPTMLGDLPGGDGLAVAGNIVWLAKDKTLQAYDVSDPTAIEKNIASREFPEKIVRIAVHDDILIVGSQSCNLWAFRIGKDLSLTELCDLFIGHGSSAILLDLVLEGDRLYAAINGAGVVAVDISDPAKLRVHSLFDTSQFAEGIAVRNGIAIVADGSGGTLVVDLRPKGYGKLVASYPTADWTYDVDNLGEYIYSCERDGGIGIFTADAFRQ